MQDDWKGNFELLKELTTVEGAADTFSKILQNEGRRFFQHTTPPNVIRYASKFIAGRDVKIVADPACGTGTLLAYAKMITNAHEAYGSDISPEMASQSSELFPDFKIVTEDTTSKFTLPKKADLIVSSLPIGLRLTEKIIIREREEDLTKKAKDLEKRMDLKLVSDAIMFNSVRQISDDGMAIFLTSHQLLLTERSRQMIKLLEDEGVFLNAAISIQNPKIPETGIKFLMSIFSRKKNETLFFGGCKNVLSNDVLHAYNSGINVEGVGVWATLEDFIGFSDDNTPLINDPNVHKEILRKKLVASASLFEFFTLGDLVSVMGSTSNGKLRDDVIWENVIFLRKYNPISTTDKSIADRWKRGYFAIELKKDKVNNEYLNYLFTRSVGKYMLDTIVWQNVMRSINKRNLSSMPVLLPSLATQDTVVEIRRQIDMKMSELDELKEMLHRLDDIDLIRAELEKVKTSQDDVVGLLQQEEGSKLEFKSSLWRNFSKDLPIDSQTTKNPKLEDSVIKTICAFLNSEGGTLLIGVSDTKSPDGRSLITGIEHDYVWCKKNNQNQDGFGQSIENLIRDKLTSSLTPLEKHISKSFHSVDGKTICRIDVIPAPTKGYGYAVFAKVSTVDEMRLFIRAGETTTMQSPESQMNYIVGHFMGEDD
ncbi:putative DNA binding domain-containing protein [Candidatus Poseidoniaceae archaeon]|nr:putative DNA binding domain-containing protein [Candidatus Poseidoniaceae archaeon]